MELAMIKSKTFMYSDHYLRRLSTLSFSNTPLWKPKQPQQQSNSILADVLMANEIFFGSRNCISFHFKMLRKNGIILLGWVEFNCKRNPYCCRPEKVLLVTIIHFIWTGRNCNQAFLFIWKPLWYNNSLIIKKIVYILHLAFLINMS